MFNSKQVDFSSSSPYERHLTQLLRRLWPWKTFFLSIERGKKSINEVEFCISASWQVPRTPSCIYSTILITDAAIAASMISRTGIMWFLYQCFGINNRKTKRILIVCAVIQIIANSLTILQIVLQCGPSPYRLVSSHIPPPT